MQKILIAICVDASLLLMSAFGFFSAFHYCDDSKPEQILLIAIGCVAAIVAVIATIGILTC